MNSMNIIAKITIKENSLLLSVSAKSEENIHGAAFSLASKCIHTAWRNLTRKYSESQKRRRTKNNEAKWRHLRRS